MKKGLKLFFICLLTHNLCFPQSQEQKASNIMSFAKLFGYVRYFHPSNQALKLNWDDFSAYGAHKVENAKSPKELKIILEQLFHPIAPTLRLYESQNKPINVKKIITPSQKINEHVSVFWQHIGVNLDKMNFNEAKNSFWSVRVFNKKDTLFGKILEPGESYESNISNEIKCVLPLVLYSYKGFTFPYDTTALVNLRLEINQYKENANYDNLHTWLGDLIVCWNIMQHFYPYFEEAKIDWSEKLKSALLSCYKNKDECDFRMNLLQMMSGLKDGHVSVFKPKQNKCLNGMLPIFWKWIDDSLIVTSKLNDSLKIKAGDAVLKINDIPVRSLFDSTKQYVSAPSIQYENFINCLFNLYITNNYPVKIDFIDQNGLTGTEILYPKFDKSLDGRKLQKSTISYSKGIKEIDSLIYYIDLRIINQEQFENLIPTFSNYKALIFDLRGYPYSINTDFLKYLLTEKDTSKHWLQYPKIVYPDQKDKSNTFNGLLLNPFKIHLSNKIVFLTDERATSNSECLLMMVKHYRLGTIVGEPTAGVNGFPNPFYLSSGYRISWSAMKVVNPDGTRFHGIGVIPDIYQKQSRQGIINNVDEILEKAIEFIHGK